MAEWSYLLLMTNLVPFLALLPIFFSAVIPSAHSLATVKVGVIMDLTTAVGRGSLVALSLAHSDFYASHPDSPAQLLLLPRNSSHSDPVDAASAALDLISNHQVAAILGPETSSSADFVTNLGARARVPIMSFTATSPTLSPSLSPFFIRAAPSDAAMGPAIATLASAFSWRRLVPIYEDSDFGDSLIPNLIDALSTSGDSQIPYRCPIPPDASDDRISMELYRLKTLQTRVFVLHAPSALAARILTSAANAGMTETDYAWILTSAVAGQLGSINPVTILNSMQGDIGVRPFIHRTNRIRDFEHRWRVEFLKQNPNFEIAASDLSPFIYYAYDSFWAVATAANTVIAANPRILSSNPASNRSSTSPAEISKIRGSNIGPKILKSIQETEFDGMSGRFQLVDGELNVSAFQIVNVNGEGARGIGFWTMKKGLSKNLNSSGAGYSADRSDLGAVIWPGESVAPPKGWEVPTGGKKMKFLVPGPVDPGFHSFLSVVRDPETGKLDVGGYVIEIFEAAVRRLPYALPFEYASMANDGGRNTVDYNALVRAVFDQEYDGVVGDVTITANRSEYGGFTFPYTASGVSMLVPVRDVRNHRAWIFLKPLTTDLWLVSALFFIFTGIIVWFLEHRINPDFRGPPSHQLGTVFYFSFSTLVFAHKETIMSNLSKLVVTIWVFVVLILTSSYTASLTSMLTVRQVQPSITDIHELIDNRRNVGYLRHSFVKGLLVTNGFHESQLFGLKSPDEYKDALSNGTVAAIIDEIPYLKLFLKSFCDNFTMGTQLYKTSGFGFVFPKGSSLVTDMSRAILNLTESNEMVEIERRWFGDQSTCPKQGSSSNSASNSLDITPKFRSWQRPIGEQTVEQPQSSSNNAKRSSLQIQPFRSPTVAEDIVPTIAPIIAKPILIEGEPELEDINTSLPSTEDCKELVADEGNFLSGVLEKLLLAPIVEKESQRHRIFHTRCAVMGKVCDLLIDSGCTENIVSKRMVKALQLNTTKHPNQYNIGLVKKGVETTVTESCKVSFSIRKHYECEVKCDVIEMDVCHIILDGRWQYDKTAWYDGKSHAYTFGWKESNCVVMQEDISENSKFVKPDTPHEVIKLLQQFDDAMPVKLPNTLPHVCAIQHQIGLIPGATLPNLPYYSMNPKEQFLLKEINDEFLRKDYFRPSLSPCAEPAFLTLKKDGSWRMSVDSRTKNKIVVKYRFPMSRFENQLDRLAGASVFSKPDLRSG
ncbi:LOW QUALITY PROTEIN: glutamate receptor 2.9-like [Phalaenopsis equestris]|uniref:LOW QUALITY PROTEIN: glutamate receptor 2.9-like n=1 Tax=Phalaenopsis equestris TaxID=78828 RepID=UPI0009E28CA5|nr:LOW QUALITY PROTEIN: glutamate receptor 2.9-like [Phalaenopsis equestris]